MRDSQYNSSDWSRRSWKRRHSSRGGTTNRRSNSRRRSYSRKSYGHSVRYRRTDLTKHNSQAQLPAYMYDRERSAYDKCRGSQYKSNHYDAHYDDGRRAFSPVESRTQRAPYDASPRQPHRQRHSGSALYANGTSVRSAPYEKQQPNNEVHKYDQSSVDQKSRDAYYQPHRESGCRYTSKRYAKLERSPDNTTWRTTYDSQTNGKSSYDTGSNRKHNSHVDQPPYSDAGMSSNRLQHTSNQHNGSTRPRVHSSYRQDGQCSLRPELDRSPYDIRRNVPERSRSRTGPLGYPTSRQIITAQQTQQRIQQQNNREVRNDSRSGSSSSSSTAISKKTNATKDDEIIHFDWYVGQVLKQKYEVTHLLGDGTFGRVLGAIDTANKQQRVAIKVIRDVARYQENAKIEAKILKDIWRNDPNNQSKCVRLYECFTHRKKYYSIVTEPLGESLYEFLKKNSFRGYDIEDIQEFTHQSLQALAFLHKMHLTHTDLKPENILLQYTDYYETTAPNGKMDGKPYYRPVHTHIKLIDFGNATYSHETHSSIINTRQYRSPEVILNSGWDEAGDLWCLGCILLELYTGELFFATHDNSEHLALMEHLLKPFPQEVILRSPRTTREKYFYLEDHGDYQVWRLKFFHDAPEKARQHVRSQRQAMMLMNYPRDGDFARFCETLLTIDNKRRPTAWEAMQATFVQSDKQNYATRVH
eukprot:GEMP01003339.1.p1 GENE.GEMP01003339.1~~GEMP01003339.1.p1  ORF type:complete len:699 (+),score=88.46 GEMP01003339.1:29-2125(+)